MKQKMKQSMSLKPLFIFPVVGVVCLTGILIAYASYFGSKNSVDAVVLQLKNEINSRVVSYLNDYVGIPHRINHLNAEALRLKDLDDENTQELMRHFWLQIQLFDSINSISLGNPDGGLVNAGRDTEEDPLYMIFTENFRVGNFYKYAVDENGQLSELLLEIPGFDSRTRNWYSDTVDAAEPGWSAPDILFTGQDLFISANYPVYSQNKQLLGVLAINLFLSQLDAFLADLEIGINGECFIMERNGLLLASSTDERPFTTLSESSLQQRIDARDSSMPIIANGAAALHTILESYDNIDEAQSFTFRIDGEQHMGTVTPFHDKYGLDWLVVSVLPQNDFFGQVQSNARWMLLFLIVTIASLSLLLIAIVQKLLKPIGKLTRMAEQIGTGIWDFSINPHSRIREISVLTMTFNDMSRKLQESFSRLEDEIQFRQLAEKKLQIKNEEYAAVNEELLSSMEELQAQNEQMEKTDKQIRGLLDEKNLILKEIHHRMKNNMNTIRSLLLLQAANVKGESVVRVLDDAANRVNSMMLLFDKLYQESEKKDVSVKDYFSPLLNQIVENFPNSHLVSIEKDFQNFSLSAIQLQSLGIILNELITNIMKYAFKGRDSGVIRVAASLSASTVHIRVEDNGNGMPESVTFESGEGFGLQLVHALTVQLKGSVRIERGEGTAIVLEFDK